MTAYEYYLVQNMTIKIANPYIIPKEDIDVAQLTFVTYAISKQK